MIYRYEPYKMDAFKKLLNWGYLQGWYLGKKELVKVTMLGAFEGFSGKASETWENRFIVEICDIPELHIEHHVTNGETLDEACKAMLIFLESERKNG